MFDSPSDQNCIKIFRCQFSFVICISTVAMLDRVIKSRATRSTISRAR